MLVEWNMVDLLRQHEDRVAELCRHYRVARLEVFGSAVTGGFDTGRSDLDFLVEFQEGFPEGPFHQYFDFLAQLKTLFGREVDLVEEHAIKNPYFARVPHSSRSDGWGLDDRTSKTQGMRWTISVRRWPIEW